MNKILNLITEYYSLKIRYKIIKRSKSHLKSRKEIFLKFSIDMSKMFCDVSNKLAAPKNYVII